MPSSAVLQVPTDAGTLIYITFFVLIFFFQFAFGTRLQSYFAINDIGRGLNKLSVMKDKARKEAIDYLVNVGKSSNDPTQRVDQFLDYVTIMPVDTDPSGIIPKIDHVVTTNNDRVRAEVGALLSQGAPFRRTSSK